MQLQSPRVWPHKKLLFVYMLRMQTQSPCVWPCGELLAGASGAGRDRDHRQWSPPAVAGDEMAMATTQALLPCCKHEGVHK
eukprot:1150577-Pelagomonas_calceolata.AAC.6